MKYLAVLRLYFSKPYFTHVNFTKGSKANEQIDLERVTHVISDVEKLEALSSDSGVKHIAFKSIPLASAAYTRDWDGPGPLSLSVQELESASTRKKKVDEGKMEKSLLEMLPKLWPS